MRELEKAIRNMPSVGGVLTRATMGAAYVYLMVISYNMVDIAGPVVVSILFLILFIAPHIYQAITNGRDKAVPRTG